MLSHGDGGSLHSTGYGAWLLGRDLHHPRHPTHVGHAATGSTLFGLVGDHGFRREQQAGNRGCVLQRGSDDLGRKVS
jgi:hypothetical protein